MKKSLLSVLVAALFLAIMPRSAKAAFTFTLSQVGSDVVASGTGTINFSALTIYANGGGFPRIYPAGALLYAGPTSFSNLDDYHLGGLSGPASFGNGGLATPSSGSGNFVGIDGSDLILFVPRGYVSNSPLTDTMTFSNATFASLGYTPGTYTYTWGTGGNADSLTIITVVPEPSVRALLGLSMVGSGVLVMRRRQKA